MRGIFKSSLWLLVYTAVLCAIVVQTNAQQQTLAPSTPALKPEQVLPVDPSVKIGTLSNGLRYYIRRNTKPEKRAEINLVVNAGSILEDENQQGLAHFLEHMAFNGTKNFAKQTLVNYLERIGMRFGPDLNAFTSFDETVYMLQIPTDSAGIVQNAFQILEDWAHNVSFDSAEVEKERGVVIEEWRLGRGAEERMSNKQLPVLLHGSRYATRLPIGKKEILESFTHETLKKFYRDWYRPDLMAVVAVGDFDPSQIERLITEHFSRLTNPANPRPRPVYSIPGHKDMFVSIVSDKEAMMSRVQFIVKSEQPPAQNVGDYRRSLTERLYNSMLSARLQEITQKPNPPFSFGFSGKSRFLARRAEVYALAGIFVKDNNIPRALDVLMTESERVRRFGFTSTEFERQKTTMLRSMEKAYTEREKTESRRFANEYWQHFLAGESIPGIETEFTLVKQLLPGITLDEINKLTAQFLKPDSRVVAVSMPQKDSIPLPSEADIRGAITAAMQKKDIVQYVDNASIEPLIEPAKQPKPSKVLLSKSLDALGATEWKFRNGVRVIFKPTDFKNDEILFTAFSPGGTSLASDADYDAVISADVIVRESGVGKFDVVALRKKLAGKIVNVAPYISELYEGFSGSCSPKDLDAALELLHAYWITPRKDSLALVSLKQRFQTMLENMQNSPDAAFQDTVQVTLNNYHPRRKPFGRAALAHMNLQKALEFYAHRFADAGDFTFVFVGAIKPEEFQPLVEKYIGSLPSIKRQEQWKDVGIKRPAGIVQKTVRKGSEPKSRVQISFGGKFEWNQANRLALGAMKDVLNIRLREVLREDMGGVYGVGVSAPSWQHPQSRYSCTIQFGCSPDRVDELAKAVFAQIDSLQAPPKAGDKNRENSTFTHVNKVKEIRRRQHETDVKENRYWLNLIENAYQAGEDPVQTLQNFETETSSLSVEMVQQAAARYLDRKNYIKIVLVPEKVVKAGDIKTPPTKAQ